MKNKKITIDEISVRLNIFDTAGQENYHSLVKSYYREVDAVILAYSIAEYIIHYLAKSHFIMLKDGLRSLRIQHSLKMQLKFL